MITAFVGKTGSGKTLDAVNKIVSNLRPHPETGEPRRIYTNIEGMDDPACQQYLKDMVGLDDYQFKKYFIWKSDKEIEHIYAYVKDNSLVVIDEVHKRFNSRDYRDESNKQMADWCSTHRHRGCDLVLITQDLEKVDKQIRGLVHTTYFYRKIDFMGKGLKKRFIVYSYDSDEVRGKPLATNYKSYDSKLYRCYKSMGDATIKEIGFMPGINIFKHPVFFVIPVVLCAFLYMFFVKSSLATGDLFGSEKAMKKYDEQKKLSASKPAPSPLAVAVAALPSPAASPVVAQAPLPAMITPGEVPRLNVPVVKPVIVVGSVSMERGGYLVLLSDGRSVMSKKYLALTSQYIK